jgi:hypothetical protein
MLNLFPGSAPHGTSAYQAPSYSLDFLKDDLLKLPKTKPLVLFFHYPIQNMDPNYWTADMMLTFARVIQGYNVIALVHGHTHQCIFYKWDLTNSTGHVYNVFNAPALQKGGATDPESTPSQYLVVEIDDAAQTLRVFQREGSNWGTISYEGRYGTNTSSTIATKMLPERGRSLLGQDRVLPWSIEVMAEGPTVTPSSYIV